MSYVCELVWERLNYPNFENVSWICKFYTKGMKKQQSFYKKKYILHIYLLPLPFKNTIKIQNNIIAINILPWKHNRSSTIYLVTIWLQPPSPSRPHITFEKIWRQNLLILKFLTNKEAHQHRFFKVESTPILSLSTFHKTLCLFYLFINHKCFVTSQVDFRLKALHMYYLFITYTYNYICNT